MLYRLNFGQLLTLNLVFGLLQQMNSSLLFQILGDSLHLRKLVFQVWHFGWILLLLWKLLLQAIYDAVRQQVYVSPRMILFFDLTICLWFLLDLLFERNYFDCSFLFQFLLQLLWVNVWSKFCPVGTIVSMGHVDMNMRLCLAHLALL